MKRLVSSLVLLFVVAGCFAQADSIYVWNKWCAKADTPLLFATANNVLCVYSKIHKATDLQVKSLDYALKIAPPDIKGDTLLFMAMPYPKLGKKMRLAITDKQTKKVLRTVNFTSAEPPQPSARIGRISGSEIQKKDLASQKTLQVYFPNSLYAYPYFIRQYTLKARIAGKDLSATGKGPVFDKDVQRILELAPPGTFLQFTDIKAACLDCEARDLPELRVWVK